MRTPNSTNIPLLAGDAENALGDDLDAFLLGNVRLLFVLAAAHRLTLTQEPDLYTAHGNRPNLQNYTTNDYIGVCILGCPAAGSHTQ